MVEILVYKTAEEAKQQLEKYEQDNRKTFEEFAKPQGEDHFERLKRQTYFFVAELAAYVDEGPAKFYFESITFPFSGNTDLYDDIQSLVQGVKDTVKCQTPKNIETILYTLENHEIENQEAKKAAKEAKKIVENYLLTDEGKVDKKKVDKKELDESLQALEKGEGTELRGLTEQERQEFIGLYD